MKKLAVTYLNTKYVGTVFVILSAPGAYISQKVKLNRVILFEDMKSWKLS